MRGVLGVALVVILAAAPAAASPWNRANGDIFVSSRVDYFVSEALASRFQRLDTDTYLEWGATPRLMLGGKAIYGQSWAEDPISVTQQGGVSEASLFAQRQLTRSPTHAFALRLAGGIEGSDVAAARTGVIEDAAFLDARALYGRDIAATPVKLFAAAEGGFRKRFNGLADQFRAEAQFGVEPTGQLLILFSAEAIAGLGGEGAAAGDFDLAKAGASIIVKASRRISISAGARQEFGLRNIDGGRGFHVGLWTEF